MRQLTPKQVARALGVSDASLKRWCDKGLIPSVRTAGGHRRICPSQVAEFLRKSGRDLVRPEILGLPATTGTGQTVVTRAGQQLAAALGGGDGDQAERIVVDLYLAGHALHDVCDRVLAPALAGLTERRNSGEMEAYQERRAQAICLRGLRRLADLLPQPGPNSPVAIGASPPGHWEWPALVMGELVLRAAGWRAEALGPSLSFATLHAAICDLRPRWLWIDLSGGEMDEQTHAEYPALCAAAAQAGCAVVLCRPVSESVKRNGMAGATFCASFASLVLCVRSETPLAG